MKKSEEIVQQVKDGYNQIAQHFSQTRYAPWTEFVLFKQYIREGQKILDLGCGNGRLYRFFKDQQLQVDYYGLDIAGQLVKTAKQKYPEAQDKFLTGNITKLPYNDNSFDSVISIATFHHLPTKKDRLKALAEVYRVLKPGGYLLMTNWHLWHRPYLKHLFNQFFQKRSWKDFYIPWKSPNGQIQCQRYYHVFTKGELKRLLKKSGLTPEKIFLHVDPNRKVCARGVNIVSIARK